MKNIDLTRVAALLMLLISHLSLLAQTDFKKYTGRWRGVFTVQDSVDVPFIFQIDKNGRVFLLNGEERFQSGTIKIQGDSLFIPLDQFDNELAFQIDGSRLSGVLRKQDHSGKPLPLTARKGDLPRFVTTEGAKPVSDISGKYDVVFNMTDKREVGTVGVLAQNGKILTGTFLRISGDSRYLEGIVEGNRFYLSSFIGSSPAYYEGSFSSDGNISGTQINVSSRQSFTGHRNDSARLPDAFALTGLKPGYTTIDFSFPGIDGRPISLKDEKYRNKVVILAISGTWCPNCIDEAAFLSPWFDKNRQRGVEVIGLHYERRSDTAFTRKVMRRFRDRFNIKYDLVFAGISQNDSVAASLPALSEFVSFPTTIFINKMGNVDKIHTGYSGPATGKYYDDFIREFNVEIDKLIELKTEKLKMKS